MNAMKETDSAIRPRMIDCPSANPHGNAQMIKYDNLDMLISRWIIDIKS